jgi:hypothetical protein
MLIIFQIKQALSERMENNAIFIFILDESIFKIKFIIAFYFTLMDFFIFIIIYINLEIY